MFKYKKSYAVFILIIFLCFNFLFTFGCGSTETVMCTNCGEQVQTDVKFCPNCGFEMVNYNNEQVANENNQVSVEIVSKWMILKYLNIYISVAEQTPTILANGQYHLSTKVSITSYSKSNDYTFNDAYFWCSYIAGGKQSLVRVDLDEKGHGSNSLVLIEITNSPTKKYNFPIESCVTAAGGTVLYYE